MVEIRLIKSQKLSVYDKLVFIVIDSYNPSFPSYSKIAKDARISRAQVAKSIKILESVGILKWKKEGRKNVYRTYNDQSTQ